MTPISTREELSSIYQRINDGIDRYLVEYRMDPSRVMGYLTRPERAKGFLTYAGIPDTPEARRVLADVLQDRHSMKLDKVRDVRIKKFEGFLAESALGGEAGHERALADYFRTSLGHVVPSADSKGTYTVDDMGESKTLLVRSGSEVEEFAGKIRESARSEVMASDIDLHRLDMGLESGMMVKARMKLDLADIVDEERLSRAIDSALTAERTLFILTSYLNDYPVNRERKQYAYLARTAHNGEEYHIWQLVDK